jgi:hypothetical protein
MSEDGPWLNVPQAVVLEATRDMDGALSLTGSDPDLLLIKANLRIGRTVIPLEENADAEQWCDALNRLEQVIAAVQGASPYSEAEQRVHQRLLSGVRTKASRTPGGPCERVDPVEFTRVELRSVDAIDNRTGAVMLYDLRINGADLIEDFGGSSESPPSADSSHEESGQMHEPSSPNFEKWDCTGDPLPKLVEWARSRWGEDLQKLPNRKELLSTFRGQFGRLIKINEKTMGAVRRQLAPEKARRGGAPMHRRHLVPGN